jgi:pyruvate dehydrogenase E2 component (dihydrolipoamide acetyltransferase)
MPSLGADMVAGRLVEWFKKPGDHVSRGDLIAEVDTDKGAIEIEVWTAGVVEQLLVEPGTKVPVGTVLALIRGEGEPAAVPSTPTPPAAVPPAPVTRVRASPLARKLAAELGVDVAAVTGSGAGGVVTREDVEAAARAKPEAGKPEAAVEQRTGRLRRAIAAAMSRSKREIPHYYLATTIDLGPAVDWLTAANRERRPADRLLPGSLFIKATGLALRAHPDLNAWWEGDRAVRRPDIHIGVAVSVRGGGLVTPALHHADRLTVDELMRGLRDLVARAREGGLRSSELTDATVTVTSLGERGVDVVTPIIYPPQVAIVGFGRIVERPWAVGGEVVVRPVVTATLGADHRATDGHLGGLFLAAIEGLLQEPDKL